MYDAIVVGAGPGGSAIAALLTGSTPLSGLFFVGCDAGGFGLGTHQAVDSAVNVSKLVMEQHRARP